MGGGLKGFLVLGGVFLCVTGAEALYADMGHFGATPISRAWNFVVFPSLILNYAGQAAIVLEGAPTDGNIFYRLCPPMLLTPLIVLATVATVIASQSIITGAFSMTRQAIRLGWLPHLKIKQTSADGYGQIYVGAVNWLLMLTTLGLTLGFGKSDNLASAYGIAVSATMLITSVLLFIAMREIWKWPAWAAGAVAAGFMFVDSAFLAANLAKLFDGGYVPLILATLVYGAMWIWHRGVGAVEQAVVAELSPLAEFVKLLDSGEIARVPGSAVFLTRASHETSPVMSWHVRKNRSLHENVLALTLTTVPTPRVADGARLQVMREGGCSGGPRRVSASWSGRTSRLCCTIAGSRASTSISPTSPITSATRSIVRREDGKGLPRGVVAIFAAMVRNAARLSDTLRLPHDQVVEIGREVGDLKRAAFKLSRRHTCARALPPAR